MKKGQKMRKLLMPFLAAIFIFTASMTTSAQSPEQDPTIDDNLVKIRLLAERTDVSGGDEIWIGIEKSIAPHWHTYWKNPGDSGTITKANWKLPEGATVSDIHWPTPKKLPYGPLMNYGYENNVFLLQRLKLPKTLPEGALTLTADIELLVCKEECIPEYGTYTLTLNGTQSETEDNSAYFEAAIAKLPVTVSWPSTFEQTNTHFKLGVTLPETIASDIKPETLVFYPHEWGLIENAAMQSALLNETQLTFSQKIGERDATDLKNAEFLVTYTNKQGRPNSYKINATPKPIAMIQENVATPLPLTTSDNSNITIATALLYAFLGGIILNLMPCVFPVLSIKALSLVKIADKSRSIARMHGIAYTAGVVLSSIAIAAILLILKSAGAQIGWGFQLQNPIVVGALAYLLFIIGLNLMGFFEFNNRLGNVGNKLTQGESLNSSFFTGILATLVATPCVAPFMAAAIGFALTQPALINLSVFAALGFGLAAPYLLLSFIPAFQRIMPKPGAWMNTFKELLSFPIFIFAIWLLSVIAILSGSAGVLQILIGMSAITFGIWLWKKSAGRSIGNTILKIIAILTFAIATFMLVTQQKQITASENNTLDTQSFGEVFTPEKLSQILDEEDEPVFVEMTAQWCITCKVNHKIAINIDSTKKVFQENNVRYLIGDWTSEDPDITKYLNNYGRNGVPIYVYYGQKNTETGQRPEAQILPQILTPKTITNLFN